MNLDEIDEMLAGADLDWGDVVGAAILLAVGFVLSYLIGRWRRRRLVLPLPVCG